MTEPVDRAALEQYAEQSYAALAARAASSGWERETDQSTWWLVVDDAFFEVELDLRELSAFVLVGPLRDGRRPGGYYVDGHQAPARWHVRAALALAGIEPTTVSDRPVGSQKSENLRAAIDALRADADTAVSHLAEVVAACTAAVRTSRAD